MESATSKANHPFLQGGGEMGERTRNFDWSKTSLGPASQWPQNLQTTISIVLKSKFPMLLYWGADLTVFYNDAFRPSMGSSGKHPSSLGEPAQKVWAEAWAIMNPPIHQVLAGGDSTLIEDQPISIYRNGKLEAGFWSYSFTPLCNAEDQVEGILVLCTETTANVLALQRLEESEQRLRNIILQAPFATCIFRGKEFVVEVANEKMFQFWGKPSAEVMHKPLFEGLPEAKGQGYEELLTGVLKTGERFTAEELSVTLPRNGKIEQVFINFAYEPLYETDGQASGIMAVAVDVTGQVAARKKLEESEALLQQRVKERTAELENLNRELKRSNSHLEEFAHAASHDLKEPIRKIHFFTNQVKNQLSRHFKDGESKAFDRIENAIERMGNLIDDLLLYSHVSQRPHEMGPVDLSQITQRVMEDLELDIEEKQATIIVGKLPVVQGHKRQLQQLFQNLLSNAIKYSQAGVTPVINIAATISAEGGNQYHVINVKDNGIGFEQEYAEKIFHMFQRLHGKGEYSGTGVGLAIVKKIVENHNGFVRVKSAPGKGTTFSVYLPVKA